MSLMLMGVGAAGAGPPYPSLLSLAGWWVAGPAYDFTDAGATTPCGINDLIYTQLDASGNSRTAQQATSGARPTLQAFGGVFSARTDATNDNLIVPNNCGLTAPSALTFFWAGSLGSATARCPTMWVGKAGSPGQYAGPEANTAVTVGSRWGMYGSSTTFDTNKTTTTNPVVVIVRCNALTGTIASTVDYYVDGGSKATFTTRSGTGSWGATNEFDTTWPSGGATLFAAADRVQNGIVGRALTDTEINLLGTYLAGQVGSSWTAIS